MDQEPDQRRFRIYFDINGPGGRRVTIENLRVQDYIRLKHNDAYTYTYLTNRFGSIAASTSKISECFERVKLYKALHLAPFDHTQAGTSMDRHRTADLAMRLYCLTPCRGTVEKDRVDDAGIQPTSTAPWTSYVEHKTQQGTFYPLPHSAVQFPAKLARAGTSLVKLQHQFSACTAPDLVDATDRVLQRRLRSQELQDFRIRVCLDDHYARACCARLAEGGDSSLDGVAERRRTDCALAVSAVRVDARTAVLDARRGLSIGSGDSEVDMSATDRSDALAAILAGQKSLEAMVASQGARLEELILASNERIDKALAAVSANEQRITQLVNEHEQLKTQVVTVRPSTDLRVHGVPISAPHDTPEELAVTFKAILALLGSPDSAQDVQDYRFFGNDPAPRRDDARHAERTFSFAVTFKQPITRNHIIRRKRRHGLIKYSDIKQGGPDAEIRLYELLPGPVYKLFRAAKARGRERNYASVWADDRRVFARKSTDSERIELVTESDVNKLA
ncbi:unnamed protein product [Trichogramma brassicae]|uniref:FP protein C-terminal domain-containing protein n=1 Tax=Trichogramma brassicae TaxID=86971 RepID=A0A6H5HZV6_9HYME|nr:unnamed protein product [Trichogramma brassicae]